MSLAQAVSDPRSASYWRYLTPAQFRQRFAPSQADVNAVQQWLRSAGFTIVYTPQNNSALIARITPAGVVTEFPRPDRQQSRQRHRCWARWKTLVRRAMYHHPGGDTTRA